MNLESRWQSLCDDADLYVERAARQILQRDDSLDEFVMAMGTAFFTKKDRKPGDPDGTLGVREVDHYLAVFIDRWHDRIKIMGSPMRFTKYGRKITQW